MTYEQKIIQGIAEGLIKPSEVTLSLSQFDDPEIAGLFISAQKMESEGLPIDLEGMFAANPDGFWSPGDFKGYISKSIVYQAIGKIKSDSSRRVLLENIRKISDEMEDQQTSKIIGRLRNAIDQSESLLQVTENAFVPLSELVEITKNVYLDLHAGKTYAIPTGFNQLDDAILDGFSKGDLHLIAGMSGNGKSALMLNFAKYQAEQGYAVGIVSLEMSKVENVMRLQSSDANIPRWLIRKNLNEHDLQALIRNLEELAKLKISLNTITGDVYSLPLQVKDAIERQGLDILYVDYAQLYTASDHASTKAGEIDKVSKTLKSIAMENQIPVVALTQFSKAALSASIFELADHFKESSSLKQDATTAIVVQLEQTEEKKQFKDAKVLVLKNRNGACFQPIELDYEGQVFTFREKNVPQRSWYEKD